MQEMERKGIAPKWLKLWEDSVKGRAEIQAAYRIQFREELSQYIGKGYLNAPSSTRVEPQWLPWEDSGLVGALYSYGRYLLWDFEGKALGSVKLDCAMAAEVYHSVHIAQFVDILMACRFGRRFGRRSDFSLYEEKISYPALGVIIGCDKLAFKLARLQLLAFRQGLYAPRFYEHYPVTHFILRLLADYLGEPPLPLRGEALHDPLYNGLFNKWREADTAVLLPLCLAVCHDHTYRTYPNKPFGMHFEFAEWRRTPIEILLLFKLRELLGLSNPLVDHPLMNTALGVLPEPLSLDEIDEDTDALLAGVRRRLRQDGYDEDAILAECLAQEAGAFNTAPAAAEKPKPSPFAQLSLIPIISPGVGLLFKAPAHWQHQSDTETLHIVDPDTGAQFMAKAYQNPGLSMPDWVKYRRAMLRKAMPQLQEHGPEYQMRGSNWAGQLQEYSGQLPGQEHASRYRLICLRPLDQGSSPPLITLTLSATETAFAKQQNLYNWLLACQLSTLKEAGTCLRNWRSEQP